MVNTYELYRLINIELSRLNDIADITTNKYIENLTGLKKLIQHVVDSLNANDVYDTLVTLAGFYVQCYDNQRKFFSDAEITKSDRGVLQSVHEEIVRIVTTWSAGYLRMYSHEHLH